MKLYVYCAGGLGREVMDMAESLNERTPRWEFIAFIDDVTEEKEVLNHKVYRFQAICESEKRDEVEIVIANGEPEARKKLFDKCKEQGFHLATLIHPSAVVSRYAKIGEGVVVREGVLISTDANVADNVFIQAYAAIGHDSIVGNNCVLSCQTIIAGECQFGQCVYSAIGVKIKHKICVGDYAILGMGAVVFRSVKTEQIVVGNPAKKIGVNSERTVFHIF